MTKRRERVNVTASRTTVARATSFFAIAVDVPGRALGRDNASFFCPEETRSGVYFTKKWRFQEPAF